VNFYLYLLIMCDVSLLVHVVILLLLWLSFVEEGAGVALLVEELTLFAFIGLAHLHEFVEALGDAGGGAGVAVRVQCEE